jgi:hypothetical protein
MPCAALRIAFAIGLFHPGGAQKALMPGITEPTARDMPCWRHSATTASSSARVIGARGLSPWALIWSSSAIRRDSSGESKKLTKHRPIAELQQRHHRAGAQVDRDRPPRIHPAHDGRAHVAPDGEGHGFAGFLAQCIEHRVAARTGSSRAMLARPRSSAKWPRS